MQERREAERFLLNLPARWEVCWREPAALFAVFSTSGCFAPSGAELEPRKLIRLEMDFGNRFVV